METPPPQVTTVPISVGGSVTGTGWDVAHVPQGSF